MNEDFLYANNWFEQKYSGLVGLRYDTTKVALNLFLQRKRNIILETGTMRLPMNWGDGCSTLLFGDFCKKYNKRLITIDISPENIEVSKQETKEFAEHITYIVSDSVKFLTENLNDPVIGLLYLDSFDCPIDAKEDDPKLLKAQQHNLTELIAALPRLDYDSVVLLDDNNFPHGGKTKETKKFLMEHGWVCVLDYYQSLWIRR